MSNQQYEKAYVIAFYDEKRVNGFLQPRFDTNNEPQERSCERYARDVGVIERLEEAEIEWQVCPANVHRSALLCVAEPEQVQALRDLTTKDTIKLIRYTTILEQKQKRKAKYIEQREREEMEKLPQDIANMQQRLTELENKYTTRVWLRGA